MTYAAEKFIEKNADRLHRDLTTLLANSSNPLAAELFTEPPAGPHNKARRHPSLSAQFKKQVRASVTRKVSSSLICCIFLGCLPSELGAERGGGFHEQVEDAYLSWEIESPVETQQIFWV